MINEDDLEIYDSSIGFVNGQQFSIKITRLDIEKLEKIRDDMLANQKLREHIIDLADLWDGAESSRYGNALQLILDELGITDMPKFYGQPMKDLLDEIYKERKND